MRPIDGLRLGRGVPPRVEDEHVVGGGEVQPHAAGLQADQKQATRRVALKALDPLLPILRASVEIFVGNPPSVEPCSQQAEKARELREDQRLVPLFDGLDQSRNQQIQLGRRIVGSLGVHQRRMTRRLTQAQQGFEHVELRLLPGRPLVEQRSTVVIAQFLVERSLWALQLADDRLLGLRRKLQRHLLLRASQDERPKASSQQPDLVGVLVRAE